MTPGATGAARELLRFQMGARTLAAIPRRLVRVGLSLEAALFAGTPVLPALPAEADGYIVTSVPRDALPRWHGVTFVRQAYVRYFVDLAAGEAAWRAALSGQARSGLKRKAKRMAAANGGVLDVRRYRTGQEMAAFHPLARGVAATTYQERLLGSALPGDAGFARELADAAVVDGVRGWLLFLGDAPIAYLCCFSDGHSEQGATLRYDYVGHDPARAALSPGSVLMAAALADLFADRFARFDFTEGEGQHKRQFASGGVAVCDALLLRGTFANRAAVLALRGFDGAMRAGKRWAGHGLLAGVAKRVRRD